MVTDVASRIPLEKLLDLKERGDKFISNVFRHRIDLLLRKDLRERCSTKKGQKGLSKVTKGLRGPERTKEGYKGPKRARKDFREPRMIRKD